MMRRLAAMAVLLALPLGSVHAAERESYLCYGGKGSFDGVPNLQLTDSFNTVRTYDAAKAKDLCLPASIDGDAVADSTTALTSYKTKLVSAVKAVPAAHGVLTSPQDLGLNATKPAYLMLPANTCLPPGGCGGLVAPTAGSHDVDAYACYSAKVTRVCASNSPSNDGAACSGESVCGGTEGSTTYCEFVSKFPKGLTAAVTDALVTAKTYDLKKPSNICTSVDIDGAGQLHPNARMACYKVKGADGSTPLVAPEGVLIADQFGVRELDVKKESILCVPACDKPSPYLAKITSLQIGANGNPGNGLDVDGNAATCAPTGSCSGGIDNAFAGIADLANSAISAAVTDGSILLLLEMAGVNLTAGGSATLKVHTAVLAPDNLACDYQASVCDYQLSNTCDVAGSLAVTLNAGGTMLSGGGPGYDLVLGIPLPGATLPITVRNLKVSATVTSSAGIVTGINGILGGAFVKQELLDTILALPDGTLLGLPSADAATLVDGFLSTVDLDLDNDMTPESVSLGLVFSSNGANVTGIQP